MHIAHKYDDVMATTISLCDSKLSKCYATKPNSSVGV